MYAAIMQPRRSTAQVSGRQVNVLLRGKGKSNVMKRYGKTKTLEIHLRCFQACLTRTEALQPLMTK